MNTEIEKVCAKCKTSKPKTLAFWHKSNQTKDRLQGFCKDCRNEHKRKYREINKESINLKAKNYSAKKSEKRQTYLKEYRNKESTKKRIKEWFKNNSDKRREYNRNWAINKYHTDKEYKLHSSFSANLRDGLKQNKLEKNRKCFDIVGYSLQQLKEHLELQFDKNMNWENYGNYWHIDHIMPKSSFKFTSFEDEEFKKCWSLQNLRPLEKTENLRKSNKILGVER